MQRFKIFSSSIARLHSKNKYRSCRDYRSKSSLANLGDYCNLNVVQSPFPPIAPPPYAPVAEFVTADWVKPSGHFRNKVAILDGSTGQTRTFREHYNDMASIAANLKYEMDITEESTIALFSPNHVDYLPICLAAALCGCKLTPVNPQYKASELATILEKSRSDVLISHWSTIDVAMEAVKNRNVKHIVVIPNDSSDPVPHGTISLTSLKKHKKMFHETTQNVHQDVANHPYLLPYSSGTTGLPKAVCLSHNNIVANLLQFDEAESLAFPSDNKLISPLPFFHIYGWLASLLYTAWRGQQLITFSDRFDLENFCQTVEKHQPQRAHLVPPILLGLAKSPVVNNYDLSSVKMIVSAAAPLSREVENEVFERIGSEVKQAWGMSELSPLGTFTSDYNIKSGSVGPLVSSTYGKVVDPKTGVSLGPNDSGELMIKGPQVMMGYLDAPVNTAECLSPGGWLKTGDISYYDEDGFFYITDRLKELIKVRGYQVAPAELESLLLTHPHIRDAAVIPVEDEDSGQLPRAYISKKLDCISEKVTEEEVKEWVKERVAPFKRLEGGVFFIDEVPKSASGKILRRLLVEKAKAEAVQ